VVGGGHSRVRAVLNATVQRDYDCGDPAADLRSRAARAGVDEPFVGMMTGVPVAKVRSVVLQEHALAVGAIVTAGIRDPVAAGVTPPATLQPGTINLIVLVDAALDPGALVNAALTATEAKVAVLQEHCVRTAAGAAATGTATDALVIACTERGPRLTYAGPATPVGYLIARTVRDSLALALRSELGQPEGAAR
jgi:iron complex transport system ATP-binding protein